MAATAQSEMSMPRPNDFPADNPTTSSGHVWSVPIPMDVDVPPDRKKKKKKNVNNNPQDHAFAPVSIVYVYPKYLFNILSPAQFHLIFSLIYAV